MRNPAPIPLPLRHVVDLLVVSVVAVAVHPALLAAGRGEPGPIFPARIELLDEERDLTMLHDLDLDIDAAFHGWARVYLIAEELEKLEALGFIVSVLPEEPNILDARAREGATATEATPRYHSYKSLTDDLEDIAQAHPDITRLTSIGQSVRGRELWMMKITRDPDLEEDEPEVAYIAGIHGDEVVGQELCFYLIEYLTDNYGINPRVTDLLDTTEIWILPSMNPDGTQGAGRLNANFRDLNRDFPDQFTDPNNTLDGRQPETQAVMAWGAAHSTNLSANYHGGALVATYPYASNAEGMPVYSPTSDDGLFVSLCRTYADNNPPLSISNTSPAFNNGITNLAHWFPLNGSLQDWSYIWRGDTDIIIEVSIVKRPDAAELPGFWDDNRESMLAFFERVDEGVRGIVTDALTGAPLAATVMVPGNDRPSYTDPDVGDYHRVLLPGTYTLEVSATGYSTRLLNHVVVDTGPAVRHDVALQPLATRLQPLGGCADGESSCDPWLLPGQAADLTVTLRNLGMAATAIGARLLPTGWFAEVTRPTASYPDLLPGGSGDSQAPHHGVTLSSDVPAGHKVGFALEWEADQDNGLSGAFFIPAGDPVCTTASASDLPLSIEDRKSTMSQIDFSEEFEVYGVTVFVDISHTYKGDLTVTLVSPTGTPVILHNRSGGSMDDIVGTYDGIDLTPFDPLSRLRGESSLGTWELRVNDGAGANEGQVNGWSLDVCGRAFETSPPEMRFREVRVETDGVRLDWWPYPGMLSYRVYRSTDSSTASAFVDVTGEDPDGTDTVFKDGSSEPLVYWLVTAVGPGGESPKGHFGQ